MDDGFGSLHLVKLQSKIHRGKKKVAIFVNTSPHILLMEEILHHLESTCQLVQDFFHQQYILASVH